ncbi:acyl carrier protein [Mesoplasma syrphidae]|uniref:Acyl carrier protein n=1 Tax=Mesoplasma syrphidae TaxID=225999 RepID=A0A2K9BJ82_9MOLU|nr:acyl carrier protein [Mesoplasma syrphidae]AUF83356.1 acyl carrier protein [Mesoplasma syrphidae]
MNIYEEIVKELKAKGAKGALTKETKVASIGIDSLDLMDMIVTLEDRLEIRVPDDKLMNLETIGDLINLVEELKQ